MSRFEYINQNLDRIKNEVRMGLFPVEILTQWAIYCRYDYYRKLRGEKKKWHFNSASFTANDFKMCETRIYKIIKQMQEEV